MITLKTIENMMDGKIPYSDEEIIKFLKDSNNYDIHKAMNIIRDLELLIYIPDLSTTIKCLEELSLNDLDYDKYLMKIINVRSEEEKYTLYPLIKNEYTKINIALKFNDDFKKIGYIEQFNDSSNIERLVNSISNNDALIELFKNYNKYFSKVQMDSDFKFSLVMEIENDAVKEIALSQIDDILYKVEIIRSLEDDKLKIKYISNPVYEEYRYNIIGSIKDFKLLNVYLEAENKYLPLSKILKGARGNDNYYYIEYLLKGRKYERLSDGSLVFTFEYLSSIDIDSVGLEELSHIDDEDIIKFLKHHNDCENFVILKNLSLYSFADYIKDLDTRFRLYIEFDGVGKARYNLIADGIAKIDDMALKIKYLEMYKGFDDVVVAGILYGIHDDEIKKKYFDFMTDEVQKINVVKGFSDDNYKLEYLRNTNSTYKLPLILSLKDDESKLEFIGKMDSDNSNAAIVLSLKNDNYKIKYIDDNSFGVCIKDIVSSLRDPRLIDKYVLCNDDESLQNYAADNSKADLLTKKMMKILIKR